MDVQASQIENRLKNRIKKLNRAEVINGEYVLYWMQQSQRAEENHTLEYTIYEANKQDKMVVVVFSLTNVLGQKYFRMEPHV